MEYLQQVCGFLQICSWYDWNIADSGII
jgi:hypothetical protein